jgi:hypothetical protein
VGNATTLMALSFATIRFAVIRHTVKGAVARIDQSQLGSYTGSMLFEL